MRRFQCCVLVSDISQQWLPLQLGLDMSIETMGKRYRWFPGQNYVLRRYLLLRRIFGDRSSLRDLVEGRDPFQSSRGVVGRGSGPTYRLVFQGLC